MNEAFSVNPIHLTQLRCVRPLTNQSTKKCDEKITERSAKEICESTSELGSLSNTPHIINP
jgi:hypothetical protein